MNKTGIVMEIKGKTASILTCDGQFINVKITEGTPSIGSNYCGPILSKLPLYKYATAVACFVLFLCFGGVAYAYYTPITSVIVKINPEIELIINRWDKIIKTIPLNDDGKSILNSIQLKNKPINEGLTIILNASDKGNFINKTNGENQISLNIISTKNVSLNINDFKNNVKSKNLKLDVKYNNGKNNSQSGKIKHETNTKNNIQPPNQKTNTKNTTKPNNINFKKPGKQNNNKKETKQLNSNNNIQKNIEHKIKKSSTTNKKTNANSNKDTLKKRKY
ncbi:anti-sigma factor domain-containing protein [Clostridium aestuarii]|uniref:Anti-sigma factor domain-containing protein n=1 Tax=Clostridium aestuarii TaxID=338193 RepID=A0ABT4D3R9_9CLOT|nr:anti-sigma factor domain-containing protein [Clostridium aestuarii]MCY6484840.1 anti-sigma factor domain-containing protein [Clostridium aestuarii]